MLLKNQNKKNITIAVCTYKRPHLLKNLLLSLNKIIIPNNTKATLLIVDNDKQESAKQVIKKTFLKIKYKYVVEKNQGLVNARNRVLEESLKLKSDKIAMIDDDETVDHKWLLELYHTKADVALGKAIYKLPKNSPLWLGKGYFFNAKEKPNNFIRKTGYTTNAMIDIKLIKKYKLKFNPIFNFSGGEDSHFFKEAYKKGAKIKYNPKAKSYETVHKSRCKASWILKRAFRTGSTSVISWKLIYGFFSAFKRFFLKGLLRIVINFPLIPFSYLFLSTIGKHHKTVQLIQKIATGLGQLAGLFNLSINEYNKIHGN